MSRSVSMIPCLTWVQRGVCKASPDKIHLDKEELKKLIEEAQDGVDEVEGSEDSQEQNVEHGDEGATLKKGKKTKKKKKETMEVEDADDIVDKYGLDDYDEPESESQTWTDMGDITRFASSEDDPYITVKNDADSDEEDNEIIATDNLIVTGRCEEDMSVLEVYVYNEDKGNYYVHHDYFLSSFPLVVEWLNFDGYDKPTGNFVALGLMEPAIEIWDLDVMESMEPALTLGTPPGKKKKKKMKKKETVVGHTMSVLDLSWNRNVRHVLASASADTTVALWDLTEVKVATTLTQHTKEVQCCKWHPEEQQTLLTGSYDNTAKLFDCRDADACHKSWKVKGVVEKVTWIDHNPLQFLTCTDQGMVYCMDVRHEKPIFTLGAHNEAVTGISLSSRIPGLLVTTSEDKTMKVWDIQNDKPSHIFTRNLGINEIHSVGCCPEAPFVFAFGGVNREPKVWDIRESAAVRNHFLKRMPAPLAKECEGDDQDVTDKAGDEVVAMEGLTMGDEDEEAAAATASAVPSSSVAKKKKKKKKAKKTE